MAGVGHLQHRPGVKAFFSRSEYSGAHSDSGHCIFQVNESFARLLQQPGYSAPRIPKNR
jgi:hypothetical protein